MIKGSGPPDIVLAKKLANKVSTPAGSHKRSGVHGGKEEPFILALDLKKVITLFSNCQVAS